VAKKNTSEPNSPKTRTRVSQASRETQSTAPIDRASDMSMSDGGDRADSPSYEEIAEAAYHRYLSRGGQDGGDVHDWVEAEQELRLRRSR
jgi:hypothetical protein